MHLSERIHMNHLNAEHQDYRYSIEDYFVLYVRLVYLKRLIGNVKTQCYRLQPNSISVATFKKHF